tara:strand:- start:4550 stop:4774 length:225 start_codon:yes stop_codon:yes gene_type:complete
MARNDKGGGQAERIAAALALVDRAICLVESAGDKGALIACHLAQAVALGRQDDCAGPKQAIKKREAEASLSPSE